jgi:mono/diheme cytochrome c family protein
MLRVQTLASAVLFLAAIPLASATPITFDNLPLGSEEKPLILRTYMPDPDLAEGYFAHHGRSANSPKYNPGTGMDAEGGYVPVKGLPAAIGVSHGPALSYAFDTLECRIAYAWQGGFLDMYPYWGDPQRGSRLSNNYVPHLVGILFHKADPLSEIFVNGKRMTELEDPKFIGYDLEKGVPVFLFSRGGHQFRLKVMPETGKPLSFTFTLSSPDKLGITYGTPASGEMPNSITQTVTGTKLATFQGFPRDMKIKEANVANGQLLYDSLGCSACHSVDGSLGHGPTLAGLYGNKRLVEGMQEPVLADEAYILESIKAPGAKTAKDFPPNYMPPYALRDLEYKSLVMFIESVAKGE